MRKVTGALITQGTAESTPCEVLPFLEGRLSGCDARNGHGRSAQSSCLARETLTARERDILAMIGQGLSNRRIARAREISPETVGKTIESAKVKGSGNDLVLDTTSFYKPTQTGAYPIVLATYEIVCSKYADADTGKAVKSFLTTTIGPGQDGLADNGYIPIPDQFKSKLTQAVQAIS